MTPKDLLTMLVNGCWLGRFSRAKLTKKYLCPKHLEKTPSAVAYANGYYCFGCGAKGDLSELGLPAGERIEITYVEDIASTLAYIATLPRKEIRGFSLPYTPRGYYLVWPTQDYYKLRIEGADAGNKYRGPSGHKKPPFVPGASSSGYGEGEASNAPRRKSDVLCLVEGEFNALSLAALEPSLDIVSPGGAGDFYSATGRKHFPEYAAYPRVDIVTDADAAGAQAAIETKAALITLGAQDVRIHLVEKDFNEILVQDGKEALHAKAKTLGLLDV
jgi:hypothetical protein